MRAIRLGGLSAAGRAMRMSPTMAARHLDALEARLGIALVNRTTRRLALTDAGVAYLERAERILADVADADAEATARSAVVEGLLRVSAPATFGVMHVVPLAAAFQDEHPGVTIELGLSDRRVDLLEERWDMAVRIGRLPDSSLIARRLAPVRLSVCAAPAYLARAGTPRTLEDLRDHECLGYTPAPLANRSWGFGRDGGIRVPVRGPFSADDGDALVRAAAAGRGLVYGPHFIAAPHVASGALVEVTLDAAYADLGAVHAITHPTRRPPARTRAWIDFLARRVPAIAGEW